jgi:hypothetical protein
MRGKGEEFARPAGRKSLRGERLNALCQPPKEAGEQQSCRAKGRGSCCPREGAAGPRGTYVCAEMIPKIFSSSKLHSNLLTGTNR